MEKEVLNNRIGELKIKHEKIKNEMFKLLEAIRILDEEYKNNEKELYLIEEEYIGLINKIIE